MNHVWGTRTTPTVGSELKRLRQERGWSLRTLGRRAQYDFSFLSRIEKGGRRASLAVAEKLDAELEAGGTLIAAWVAENRVARPAQLPAAPSRFVGRDRQLAELARIVTNQTAAGPVVVAIDGPAGAGKTALALRCANDVANRFFDGQLYADLGGFTAHSSDLAEPAAVLLWFCIALGAEPTTIPVATAERAALYRSLLANRRVLVVLDNAADSRHVEHLLPGTGRCAAIVTSRRLLSGLAVRADARRLAIGPLPEADSIALVTQVIGVDRADREPDSIPALSRLCGHLPLALRVAADRVVAHPEQSVHAAVTDLTAESNRLDYFETGDSPSVRSVISWSYARLSAGDARMFRLLASYPRSTINVQVASAMAGVDLPVARRGLRGLSRLHLVEMESTETVQLDGLLRAYALERAREEDEPAERIAALDRLAGWYLSVLQRVPRIRGPHWTIAKSSSCVSGSLGPSAAKTGPADALGDMVAIAEAVVGHGPVGGSWRFAAALWAGLLGGLPNDVYGDGGQTKQTAADSARLSVVRVTMPTAVTHAIPRQAPVGHSRDHRDDPAPALSGSADQGGLAWTIAGAALAAIAVDDNPLAHRLVHQARQKFRVTGDHVGLAVTVRLADALHDPSDTSIWESKDLVDAARLVAEHAHEHPCGPHLEAPDEPEEQQLGKPFIADAGYS